MFNWFKYLVSDNNIVSSNRVLGIGTFILYIIVVMITILSGADSTVIEILIRYTFYLIVLLLSLKSVDKMFGK